MYDYRNEHLVIAKFLINNNTKCFFLTIAHHSIDFHPSQKDIQFWFYIARSHFFIANCLKFKMHRTLTREGLSVYQGFGGLQDSTIDLSNFQSQLTKDRISRTMTFQKINRPSIARFCKKIQIDITQKQLGEQTLFLNDNILDEKLKNAKDNDDNEEIIGFLKNVIECSEDKYKDTIDKYLNTDILVSKMIDCLQFIVEKMETNKIPLMCQLLNTMVALFPLSKKEIQEIYVDDGLCFLLMKLLDVNISPDLLLSSIGLIGVMSENDSYARDALICNEIHFNLIELVSKTDNVEVINASCEALSHVFENPEQIDFSILLDCFKSIASLLNINSKDALQSILVCIVDMTVQMPSLIFSIFEMNFHKRIVELLPDPELTAYVLRLIDNMSIAQPSQINELLKCGLFSVLTELLMTEFTGDVFCVLSNLLESVPEMILNLINEEFIDNAIEIAMYSSIGVKKEASYFLATAIIFSNEKQIEMLLKKDLFDVLFEMIDCDIVLIILRIIDSLVKIINLIKRENKFIDFYHSIMTESNISKVYSLKENKEQLVVEHVNFLISQYNILNIK